MVNFPFVLCILKIDKWSFTLSVDCFVHPFRGHLGLTSRVREDGVRQKV